LPLLSACLFRRWIGSSQTDDSIIWTYETAAGLYMINAVPELGVDDPNNTPTIKRIRDNDNDPAQVDGDPQTVTLRDNALSPVDPVSGGPTGPYPDPAGGPGIVNSDMVTFYAFDGGSVLMESTIFYTDDEGVDRFSQAGEACLCYLSALFMLLGIRRFWDRTGWRR
jgi:hypothetical protein